MLRQHPLLSVELHYFRIPRDDWALMLVRAVQLGANTISTYVPWAWHELRSGQFDFDGSTHPQRNLIAFVQLCAQLGLRVIVKPGPFIDAETLGGGIPPWFLAAHPEVRALRYDGEVWRHSDSQAARVCTLHPVYLEAARRWIAAFSQAILPYQSPQGPVFALQAENETPGDGMLPGDIGLDARLRLDCHPYVRETLWPRWCATQPPGLPEPFPSYPPDGDPSLAVAVEAFTDWYFGRTVAVVAEWLREDGWNIPVFHDLLGAPWQRTGTIVGIPELAQATGWLGFNVYAEDVTQPFVGQGYMLSFEEYVHYAFWRTRLVRHLSGDAPVFLPEISAAQDFYFAAPLVGGAEGLNVYMGAQTYPDNPEIGAFAAWAMEAPIRPDGSLRLRSWNAKIFFMLLQSADGDYAAARSPAALAIGYSHVPERAAIWAADTGAHGQSGADAVQTQLIAQRLVRDGMTFDLLDLDAATPEHLAQYALLVVPASRVLARAVQAKLAVCANLALIGDTLTEVDEQLQPCALLNAVPLRLPVDVSGKRLGELVEELGGMARYAWANEPDVDVSVRYGETCTYLFVANRRLQPYSGVVAYRGLDHSVQHVHLHIGGLRVGALILRNDEVIGVAMGGDASEGGWLARGLHTSIVFSGGAGVVAPCGSGLLLSASHSGRFQMRRPAGWPGMAAYRLLLGGRILPIVHQTEAAHIHVPFLAEDEAGQTDLVVVVPNGSPLPEAFRRYLAVLLQARAAVLHDAALVATTHAEALALNDARHTWVRASHDACVRAGALLANVAEQLAYTAQQDFDLQTYMTAWESADDGCTPVVAALMQVVTLARGDYAAGLLEAHVYEPIEQSHGQLLRMIVTAALRRDREW